MTTDSTPQATPEPASSEASGVGLILGSRLRQQVVGTNVALTLIAMAALTLLVHEVLASTVEGDVSGLLQDRADAVTSTLIVRDGQVLAQETPTETLDRSTWVYDNTGRLVEGRPLRARCSGRSRSCRPARSSPPRASMMSIGCSRCRCSWALLARCRRWWWSRSTSRRMSGPNTTRCW